MQYEVQTDPIVRVAYNVSGALRRAESVAPRIILRTILRVIVRFCTKVYSACTDSRVQSFALLSCNRSLFLCSKTNATYTGRAANRL